MQNRRLTALVCLLLCVGLWLPGHARTTTGQDITFACRYKMSGGAPRKNPAFDRKYKTGWRKYGPRKHVIEIKLPDGVQQGGLYLCFALEPARLDVYQNSQPQPFYTNEGEGFAHRYVPYSGGGSLRLEMTGTEKGVTLSELFVFEGAEPPAWVQRWQPPLEKADMLVLVAHPDDELLWFGGAIPYYALERELDVAVATMTCANPLRRSEALNGLWMAGVRHYPYFGGFRDKRMPTMRASYEVWGGEQKVKAHIVGLLRQLQPQVLLTHDLNGEYGHPAHKVTAAVTLMALEAAGNPRKHADSAERHGVWDVPKTYLHLYPDNPIEMAWQQPITAHSGITALEVADLAFQQHRSQRARFRVDTKGPHSAARFGLYRSLVGEDIQKDDFFENIR